MNKLITILTLLALALPVSTLAQPEERPGERPERDREAQRERGERGDRPDRPEGDRQRPGDREGDRGDWRSKREPIAVEQVGEAIATIRAIHGDEEMHWLDRIEEQAKEDPAAAARYLSRYPRLHQMMEARKNNPEEFELLKKQSLLMRGFFGAMGEVRKANREQDQAKLDELRPKVRDYIDKLFQVRLDLKELEIKQIAEKLAIANEELAEIKADREALIEEKVNDIMTSKPRGSREEGDRRDRDERRPKPDRDE